VERAYILFSTMGLRHLVVVDEHNRVRVGARAGMAWRVGLGARLRSAVRLIARVVGGRLDARAPGSGGGACGG
jgi:hypothetical protein